MYRSRPRASVSKNMATLTATLVRCASKEIPKSKRKLQKHLRSAGLAYISRTGKVVPAKTVAEELCQCPHKCEDRVPRKAREKLFEHFYGLGDPDLQNAFLRAHMDVRARPVVQEPTNSGRQPRRITCKYLVPLLPGTEKADVCQKAFVSAFVITTKRVRLQREKLISSLGLNVYSHSKPPCLPTEENNTTWSFEPPVVKPPKKPPLPRPVDDPLVPPGLWLPEGVTIAPVTASPDHDRDIAIVNNFFYNQLWKPEYIGTYS